LVHCFPGESKKESAMQTLTHVGSPLVPHHDVHLLQHTTLRRLHAHLRGWSRPENLVASVSLLVVVMTVLALLCEAI
jgi:hypothetical protein